MPLREGFIALPIVYLVRLDELRLKSHFKNYFKQINKKPILMYGLETLPLQKNQLNSLDFVTVHEIV